MPIIQNKRSMSLTKINQAALKAGELAVFLDLTDPDRGLTFVGTDGAAGHAIGIRSASSQLADAAQKLATARDITMIGDVVSTNPMSFDGSANTFIETKINPGTITKEMLDTELNTSIGKANDSVQTITPAQGNSGITIGGTATQPTISIKLDPATDNDLKSTPNGLKVDVKYTIVKKAAPDAGDFATYQLQKDGVDVAGSVINIPMDYLVKSADLKVSAGAGDPSGLPAGHQYIDFVINVEQGTGNESHIYLDVNDLVDVYTSGSAAGDPIVVAIDNDNKVTATVTNGKLTKEMFEQDVQDTLDKADSALQVADIVATGAAGTDGTITIRGTEIAIKGLGSAAFKDVGVADGVAGLDANGKLPDTFIPDISGDYISTDEIDETIASLDADKKVKTDQLPIATKTKIGVIMATDEIEVATDGKATIGDFDCGTL